MIGELTTGALFFGMRSCEYLQVTGERKTKLLRLKNIRFFIQKRELNKLSNTSSLFQATTVTITFEFQKNGDKEADITMHRNNKELCPVKAWATIVSRILSYPSTSLFSPVNTILINGSLSLISSKEVIHHIRSTVDVLGEDTLGISPKDVGVHSIRCSFAMFLYTQFVKTDKIMLQGRWKSDAFLVMIRAGGQTCT